MQDEQQQYVQKSVDSEADLLKVRGDFSGDSSEDFSGDLTPEHQR